MAALVLVDYATQKEMTRRPMLPAERYHLYHQCFEHELLEVHDHLYTIHRVAWRTCDEACVVDVTYHSAARLGCGCRVGDCVCD